MLIDGVLVKGASDAGLIIASYVKETTDPANDFGPRRILIHNNSFRANGLDPDDSEFGGLLRELFGAQVPQVVWDGVMPVWCYLTVGEAAGRRRNGVHDRPRRSRQFHPAVPHAIQ